MKQRTKKCIGILILMGSILNMFLFWEITPIILFRVFDPINAQGQQKIQENQRTRNEAETDAILSSFHTSKIPYIFYETENWTFPRYPTPSPQVPQIPSIPSPSPLPTYPEGLPHPKRPNEKGTVPKVAKGVPQTELGPPSWVKPGVRLTFYAASASIPGSYTELVEDERGNLIDSTTGKQYSERGIPSAAGQGYLEVQICYVDSKTAALDIRAYGKDILTGAVIILSVALGHVGPAHTGGEYWIHPRLLSNIPERLTPGQKILRMPYHLDGKTYRALRIQTKTSNGFAYHTYDLDTGVLLSSGGSALGSSVPTLGPGTTMMSGAGSNFIGLIRFKSMRQLKLPWVGGPTPDWVFRTRSLTYSGTKIANVVGAGVYSFPITATLSFQQTGPGWLKFLQQGVLIGPSGMPPTEGNTERIVGTSQVGGLWIPPNVLRQLRSNQVLDQDNFTHMQLSVKGLDTSGLHIIEEGPRTGRSYVYNLQNGMLVGYSDFKKLDRVTETNSLKLKEQK